MHKLFKNKLPTVIHAIMISQRLKKFMITKLGDQADLIIFLLRVTKSAGQKKIEFCGVKLWNEISENLKKQTLQFFQKAVLKKIC